MCIIIIYYFISVFQVLIFTLGVASGDIGLDYKVPQTSYGVPSYQLRGNSGQIGRIDSPSIGYNYKPPVNKFLEHSSSGEYASSTSAQKFGIGIPSSLNIFQNEGTGDTKLPSITSGQYIFNGGYHSSSQEASDQKYQQYYYTQNQPAEVYRHFYIHSAPEEPELPKLRRPISLPPPQKHYKIIFVKAPTESRAPQIVPVAPQNEEKTIVYVLVKKPEDPEVIVPKIEQKPPTKPEVYYIKYNNKQDSQAVIDNIVNDYNKGNILTESSEAFGAGSQFFDSRPSVSSNKQSTGIFSNQGTSGGSGVEYSTTLGSDSSHPSSSAEHETASFSQQSVLPFHLTSGQSGTTINKPLLTSSSGQYSSANYGTTISQQPSRPFSSSPVTFGAPHFQQPLRPSFSNRTSGDSGTTLFHQSTGHLPSIEVTSGDSPATLFQQSTGHLPSNPVTSGSYASSIGQQLSNLFPSRNVNTGSLPTAAVPTGGLSIGSLTTDRDVLSGSLTTGGLSGGSVSTGPYRPPPVTLSSAFSSTTASSLVNDHANAISTSQGVPHETYGPPKFRPN